MSTCNICLCSSEEQAPFLTSEESQDIIQPCTCSFTTHRKCLLFDLRVELLKQQSPLDRFRSYLVNRQSNEHVLQKYYTPSHYTSGLISTPITNKFTVPSYYNTIVTKQLVSKQSYVIKCPLCRSPILLSTPKSIFLNNINELSSLYKLSTLAMLIIGTSYTIIDSTKNSILMLFSIFGSNILEKLCKDSVIISMFGKGAFPASLFAALNNDVISTPNYIFLSAYCVPYTFLLINSSSSHIILNVLNIFTSKYVFGGFKILLDGNISNVSKILIMLPKIKLLSILIYRLTINKMFYKWFQDTQSCFLTDAMSIDDAWNAQSYINEKVFEEEEEKERTSWHSLMKKIRQIFISSWACLINDYSNLFNKGSVLLQIANTAFVPYVGKFIGVSILSHFRISYTLSHLIVNTPDEVDFVLNLVGCGIMVILENICSWTFLYFSYCLRTKFHIEKDPSFIAALCKRYGLTNNK